MHSHIRFYSAVCLLFLFVGCSTEADNSLTFADPNPYDVEIRVKNSTSFEIDQLQLNAFSREANYFSLMSGETSVYHSYPFAYDYIGLEFSVRGSLFSYQPGSQQGEKLEKDRYEVEILQLDTLKRTFRFRLKEVRD